MIFNNLKLTQTYTQFNINTRYNDPPEAVTERCIKVKYEL